MWLCNHAEVTQQDNGCDTVGTAVDQELPVWGTMAESASQLFLSHSQSLNIDILVLTEALVPTNSP